MRKSTEAGGLYEDEIRSVAVGYANVGLAGGLEIAFARKRKDDPEGTAPLVSWASAKGYGPPVT